MLPERIGRYDVLGELGSGGMAQILLCRVTGPSGFRRPVVLKRILRHLTDDVRFVEMFIDEARTLGRVQHPNVVQAIDFAQHDGQLYLVMEYAAGEALSSLFKRLRVQERSLDPALAAFICAEACAGLHASHELVGDDGQSLGVVHRDVSPQNLLLTYDGHVKVLDFGISTSTGRMTKTDAGQIKGKAEYMAPEQARGEPVGRTTDIFALGVVLYELTTGRRLYALPGQAQVFAAICLEPPVPPSRLVEGYPKRLEDICLRALEKKPEDRYATAALMRRDLLEVARELTDPTEQLAQLMRELFADRIERKTALLDAAPPPRSEDVSVVLVGPTASVADAPTEVAGPPHGVEPVPDGPVTRVPGRRRAGAYALAAAVALLGLAIFAAVVVTRRQGADAASPPRAGTAPLAVASSPPVDPPARPAPLESGEPPAATVSISVRTVPDGARVLVDGAWKGDTPIVVTLPRGSRASSLRVERTGFVPVTESLTPDRDQSLRYTLSQARAAPRPAATPSSKYFRFP